MCSFSSVLGLIVAVCSDNLIVRNLWVHPDSPRMDLVMGWGLCLGPLMFVYLFWEPDPDVKVWKPSSKVDFPGAVPDSGSLFATRN